MVAGHNHSQDREAVGHTQDRHTPVRVHSRILEVVVPVVEEVGSKIERQQQIPRASQRKPSGPGPPNGGGILNGSALFLCCVQLV